MNNIVARRLKYLCETEAQKKFLINHEFQRPHLNLKYSAHHSGWLHRTCLKLKRRDLSWRQRPDGSHFHVMRGGLRRALPDDLHSFFRVRNRDFEITQRHGNIGFRPFPGYLPLRRGLRDRDLNYPSGW